MITRAFSTVIWLTAHAVPAQYRATYMLQARALYQRCAARPEAERVVP